jgi:phosphatidylserine decarboxylase
VVVIERVFEPEFLKREVIQVSVFMSPLNVHINFAPVSGKTIYYKYHPGKYLVAWHPKSSQENERTTTVFERPDGKQILVRQIAGALAKRIVNYTKQNGAIRQGDEFGFIKFGSRVDLFLPLDAEINVNIGDKAVGNRTVIAHLN